jgi:flagellar biosynthesis/type III secretory pathway protein FliH
MATVVRGTPPTAGHRIEGAVHDASLRATEIVRAAEEQARALVSAAATERDRVRAEAAEEGRAQGLASAAGALASAEAERDRRLAALGAEVAAIAVDVARKVLGRELRADPGAVVEIARAALEAARGRRGVTLRVHPRDAPAVRAGEARLRGPLSRCALLEDERVEPGGAIVESEGGRVDARIETQLAALLEAMREAAR